MSSIHILKTTAVLCIMITMAIGSALAQNPLVKMWDYRFGGTLDEQLWRFQQTTDGGFILAGSSTSGIGGDKTQPHWGTQGYWDYWIVKIDAQGTKQWDKTFGGTKSDNLYAIRQTTDGGFILGGHSQSPASGDKTQGVWGDGDYWVVKTDSLGNKLWDADYGGVDNDVLYDICLTADGGYILTGYSTSGISGDKTTPNWGFFDYWIIKIDSLGNKQWEQDYGGTGEDHAVALMRIADGGYLLIGSSQSGISGTKTQPSWGTYDFWILKIDSLGNVLWDKDLGGSGIDWIYSFVQTSDNGFVLGGISYSGISGDKSVPLWGIEPDFWILKTDSLCNKIWDKDYGGTDGEDEFGSIVQTTDGGYLLAGTSYSNISGDKTEDNLGNEQSWILKIDSSGTKQWDKTLLTNITGDDEIGLAIQTNDGCFAMANSTSGGVGGDKSQPSWGARDYWILKFCDSTLSTNVSGGEMNWSIEVFPNPTTEMLSVFSYDLSATAKEISIYNLMGERVMIQESRGKIQDEIIDVSKLESGMYSIEIISGENIYRGKFVKSTY